MLKMVYCIRRHPDLSVEEFQRYWLEQHGPKVRSVAETIGARRYVQSHTRLPDYNESFRPTRGLKEGYDGITEIWWDSMEDFARGNSEAGRDAAQMLLDDERGFIDFANSCVFMTEEFEIFDLASSPA